MITPSLEASLNQAFQLAQKHKHEFVTLEHLLFALLSDPDALNALKACSGDTKELQVEIEQIFTQLPTMKDGHGRPEPTLAFNRTLQRSIRAPSKPCKAVSTLARSGIRQAAVDSASATPAEGALTETSFQRGCAGRPVTGCRIWPTLPA